MICRLVVMGWAMSYSPPIQLPGGAEVLWKSILGVISLLLQVAFVAPSEKEVASTLSFAASMAHRYM